MNEVITLFAVIAIGYFLGNINFFGVKFGNAAIIIVGIIFGHFNATLPPFAGTIGLVLFISAVGTDAGKSIVYFLKENGLAFVAISVTVIALAGVLLSGAYLVTDFSYDMLIGVLAGAMTSTTALAAAQELGAGELAAVGYGIAYILGVLLVVLFVQLTPKIMKADYTEETRKLQPPKSMETKEDRSLFVFDKSGIFIFSTIVVLGMALGSIVIPLGGGLTFSFGNSGGTLIVGLIFGHIKKLGKISIEVPKTTLNVFSNFGISLFLANSGVSAGGGFVSVIREHGLVLIAIGALITFLTSLVGYLMSRYVFKIPMFGSLGATTGAMTSAPSLGALIDSSGTDLVTPFYAATQPVATMLLVFLPQILQLIFRI